MDIKNIRQINIQEVYENMKKYKKMLPEDPFLQNARDRVCKLYDIYDI